MSRENQRVALGFLLSAGLLILVAFGVSRLPCEGAFYEGMRMFWRIECR